MADITITCPTEYTDALHVSGTGTFTPFLYVCDSGNNRIQVFDYIGNLLFAFGSYGTGNGQFNSPYGVTNDGVNVFVSDTGNDRVQVFDLYGNFLYTFGSFGTSIGQFINPKGIAVDATFIYVVDQANNRFQIFLKDGLPIMSVGTFGSGVNQFNTPTNIYVDEYYIYIDDTGNSRVVIYEKNFLWGFVGSITLPMLTVTGSFTGQWYSGAVTLPMLTVSGELMASGELSGSAKLPMLRVSGAFTTENDFSAAVTLPMLAVSGTFTAKVDFSADVTLPMLTVSGEFTSNGAFSAAVLLPMLTVSGAIEQILAEVYRAISINTENFALTEFTNYPFNSMCEFNGKYYASGPAGVTRLDGTTDLNSTVIEPVVRFGTNDLHKGGVKGLVDSYFVGISGDNSGVKVVYDQDEYNPFETDIPEVLSSRESARIRLPQGMKKKRFVAVEISNATEIDSMRLIVMPVPGRLR